MSFIYLYICGESIIVQDPVDAFIDAKNACFLDLYRCRHIIYAKINENRCKIDEKSISNKPGFVWASRSCLRPQFGGSWAHLGSKRAGPGPFWAPSWGPKSAKIGAESDLKCDQFFDRFGDRVLEQFGTNLAPFWPPKPPQNGAKLAPKSIQVGVLIWELFFDGCWIVFYWILYPM